jgi:transcriptional regulator with XRE-family HTH domain
VGTKKSSLIQKFGKKLVALRQEKGMTQENLAEAAGISVDFLSLMERGLRAPSFSTLEKLSRVLDIPVKDLFDFDQADK